MKVWLVLCLMVGVIACDEGCRRSTSATRDSGADVHRLSTKSKLGNRPIGDGWEVVDPYCGMRLRRAEAAATMEYRGRTYYFCLEDHRDAFARDPERYLSRARGDGSLDGGGSREAGPPLMDGGD